MPRKVIQDDPHPEPDRPMQEPSRSSHIELHKDLTAVYRLIRESYQTKIDGAFDRASRQIGFIVTTTVPWILEVDKKGRVGHMKVGADHLRKTIFERELSKAMRGILEDSNPLPPGPESIYLIWVDALKLQLKTEWLEPAHPYRPRFPDRPDLFGPGVREPAHWGPGVREPAHWLHPGVRIAAEERVLISVIDEVYPELRLAERLTTLRAASLREDPNPEPSRSSDAGTVLAELASVLRRFGY